MPKLPSSPPPNSKPDNIAPVPGAMPFLLVPYLNTYIYLQTVEGQEGWLVPNELDDIYLHGHAWIDGQWQPTKVRWRMIRAFH
ncbi:hypothetical protein LJC42_06730 [Eubacteriales bacterium OttesenSCG-928-K08]|nr:hypothetical protein [Eubacteriales bacterium OttesenSCG-928-K08]